MTNPDSIEPQTASPDSEISGVDLEDLIRAKKFLESPTFAIRMSNLLGEAIESLVKGLPEGASDKIAKATTLSLEKAAGAALFTLEDEPGRPASSFLHGVTVAGAGLVGGAAGLAGLVVELPISTVVMVRSIADIARSEGESVKEPDLVPEMLSVFAMGGPSSSDDGAESAYYAIRAGLAKAVSEAAAYFAEKGAVDLAGPVLVRLISKVAARFQVQVSQKAASQVVPLIGAVAGAGINAIFIDHFQCIARGHFIVRRLERKYGDEAVRAAYGKLS